LKFGDLRGLHIQGKSVLGVRPVSRFYGGGRKILPGGAYIGLVHLKVCVAGREKMLNLIERVEWKI